MTTQRKLTVINGVIDQEGGIQTYRAMNSFEIGSCPSGDIGVPPLPFPDDDDDWDNFDRADDQAE